MDLSFETGLVIGVIGATFPVAGQMMIGRLRRRSRSQRAVDLLLNLAQAIHRQQLAPRVALRLKLTVVWRLVSSGLLYESVFLLKLNAAIFAELFAEQIGDSLRLARLRERLEAAARDID